MKIFKTYSAKEQDILRSWYLVDAEKKVLGRMATRIARILRGKHKAVYTPHVDTGDFVVVTNAAKVTVTGDKADNKVYYRHSGYPGGLKSITLDKLLIKNPEEVIRKAVKGMLPRGPLGRVMLKKLKIYAGAEHPHAAQQPQVLNLTAGSDE